MTANLDVLAIGNINTDVSFYVDRAPGTDEEVTAKEYFVFQGGSAANFSVAASKLGLKAGMLGCVGSDIFGKDAIRSLRRAGVCTDFIRVSKSRGTGIVCVLVSHDCERSMVAFRGANLELEGIVENKLPSAKITQLSNVSRKVLRSVLYRKENYVSLDPGGEACSLKPHDLEGLDLLLLNDAECRSLTGLSRVEGASTLLHYVDAVIVKLGKWGAYLKSRDLEMTLPAFRVEVSDTTGAGDAFDAGVIAALSGGRGLEEALLWGSGTAALKIQKRGARNGLPTRNGLTAFLGRHGDKEPVIM